MRQFSGISLRRLRRLPPSIASETLTTADAVKLLEGMALDDDEGTMIERLMREMDSVCGQRAVFATEGGRIGIGRQTLQVGDQIWLLAGAKVPFILRESHDGHMEVVSETYVDGMMFGELWPSDETTLDDVILE